MDVLLSHGAPLEQTNSYGGTVLDSTIWAAIHTGGIYSARGFEPVEYRAVLKRLVAAGARCDAVALPSGNAAVDELLAGLRARPS